MFDPLLLDFPDSFESSRLIIRPPRPGDGRRHHEAVAESLDHLRKFPASLPWAMAPPSVESSEAYCRSAHANFIARKDLPLLLLDRSKIRGRFLVSEFTATDGTDHGGGECNYRIRL